MYFPEGFDLREAFLLSELVSTAYDMQSQWKEQDKPRPDKFEWIPKGPNLNYSKPLWGTDRLLYFFHEHEPYAFIATGSDGTAYLVFRGTDSDADWVENLKFDQIDYTFAPGFGKTNQGFTSVYSSMSADILDALSGLTSVKRLLISGHSLGSALSTLAVPDIYNNLARPEDFEMIHCNFASPRTGDQSFAAALCRSNGFSSILCCISGWNRDDTCRPIGLRAFGAKRRSGMGRGGCQFSLGISEVKT
ncbi:MAG: lipase family protein [Cyanobacteriota bacterium]|nr:lipase family protein [Cyanobacteriota bacterium]